MFRLLLVIGLGVFLFAGCKKDNTNVTNQVKAQAAIDDKILQEYISRNNLQNTFKRVYTDSTGLWYSVTPDDRVTSLYTASTLVTVGYKARLLSTGNPNTYQPFRQTDAIHPSFRISEMIKAWGASLLKSGCGKGKTIRILTASRYAYGPYTQSSLGLEPNSILDFEITVYDVVN